MKKFLTLFFGMLLLAAVIDSYSIQIDDGSTGVGIDISHENVSLDAGIDTDIVGINFPPPEVDIGSYTCFISTKIQYLEIFLADKGVYRRARDGLNYTVTLFDSCNTKNTDTA